MGMENVKELLVILIGSSLVSNVVLSQFLGLCPFLGVSRKTNTAAGMGAAVIFVITLASAVAGVIYRFVLVRFHVEYLETIVFILVIAALVQFVEMFLRKAMPALYEALGVYLPLIVVNCIILARAESFASKSKPLPAAIDGICQGLGYTMILLVMSAIRELLGAGTLNGVRVFPAEYAANILILPVGGFLTLGCLIALMQWIQRKVKGGK